MYNRVLHNESVQINRLNIFTFPKTLLLWCAVLLLHCCIPIASSDFYYLFESLLILALSQ
jgi:hypothetical protein